MSNIEAVLSSLPADQAARRLLGCELVRTIEGSDVRVRIVETEAYHQSDAASHSYKGLTARTEVMFGQAARLYVYFTYGMHYCCNIVTGPVGEGSAVLIRAVEPIDGEEVLQKERTKTGLELTNGPAKLCQAMRIDKTMNGHDLQQLPLRLLLRPELEDSAIIQSTRIGISKAVDVLWRFYIRDNPYVSKL